MAHQQQYDFVSSIKEMFPEMFENKKVLEVGSLNINGSIRGLFSNCCYIGIDLDYGLGVDLIAMGHNVQFRNGFFDTVISCECFEHNPFWLETFFNMTRMCSGLVVFTCATDGRQEHGTRRTSTIESPFTTDWDYYRNITEDDFKFVDFSIFDRYEFSTNDETHDLYFWGIKNV